MADENVQANEAGDGLEAAGESGAAPSEDRVAALESSMKDMAAMLKDVSSKLDSKSMDPFDDRFLDALAKSAQEEEASASQAGGEFDPDAATQAELMAHVMTKVNGLLDEKLGASSRSQNELKQYLGQFAAQMDLRLTEAEHPDLREKLTQSDYKEKFYVTAKNNPSWGAGQVYKQVEMEVAHEAQAKAKAEAERAERELSASSEKGGVPKAMLAEANVSPQKAAEMAFHKAFGNKNFVGEEV